MSLPKIINFELDNYDGPIKKACVATINADTDQLRRVLQIAAMPASARPLDLILNMRWPGLELCYQSVNLVFYADNVLQMCRVRKDDTLRTVRVALDTLRMIAESPVAQRFHIIGVSEKFQSRVFKIVDSRFTWQYHHGVSDSEKKEPVDAG